MTDIRILQWCESGRPLDCYPGIMARFLSDSPDSSNGYGYGSGWGMVFYHPRGNIELLPQQWVIRNGLQEFVILDNGDKHYYDLVRDSTANHSPEVQSSAVHLLGVKALLSDDFVFALDQQGQPLWSYIGRPHGSCRIEINETGTTTLYLSVYREDTGITHTEEINITGMKHKEITTLLQEKFLTLS